VLGNVDSKVPLEAEKPDRLKQPETNRNSLLLQVHREVYKPAKLQAVLFLDFHNPLCSLWT